jgi:hypothetical protein
MLLPLPQLERAPPLKPHPINFTIARESSEQNDLRLFPELHIHTMPADTLSLTSMTNSPLATVQPPNFARPDTVMSCDPGFLVPDAESAALVQRGQPSTFVQPLSRAAAMSIMLNRLPKPLWQTCAYEGNRTSSQAAIVVFDFLDQRYSCCKTSKCAQADAEASPIEARKPLLDQPTWPTPQPGNDAISCAAKDLVSNTKFIDAVDAFETAANTASSLPLGAEHGHQKHPSTLQGLNLIFKLDIASATATSSVPPQAPQTEVLPAPSKQPKKQASTNCTSGQAPCNKLKLNTTCPHARQASRKIKQHSFSPAHCDKGQEMDAPTDNVLKSLAQACESVDGTVATAPESLSKSDHNPVPQCKHARSSSVTPKLPSAHQSQDTKEFNVSKITLHGIGVRGHDMGSNASQLTGGRLKGFMRQHAAPSSRLRGHSLGTISPTKTILDLLLERQKGCKTGAGGACTSSATEACKRSKGSLNAETGACTTSSRGLKSSSSIETGSGMVHAVSRGSRMPQESSSQRVRVLNISSRCGSREPCELEMLDTRLV